MNLIISGTNRENSYSYEIALYYQKSLAKKGQDWEILTLTQLPSELIQTDLYGKRSPEFKKIQDQVTRAKKFIFIIPEYNGSFPGILKLFIDACSFPDSFHHKKAALVGLSSGKYGNIRGVDHFTGVCSYLRMHVLPLKIHIPLIRKEMDVVKKHFIWEKTKSYIDEQIEEIAVY